MRSRTLIAAIGLLVLLALAGCGAKKEEGPLLRMLRLVPDEAEYRAWVAFGDLAAWHESWGLPRADSLEELKEWDREPRAYWMNIMPRQTLPGVPLQFQYFMTDDQRGAYGFDIFSIDRYVEAGEPPRVLAAVEFGFDRGRIASALESSGYTSQALEGGWTLYSVGEDYKPNLQSASQANLTGRRNRIALAESQLVYGSGVELVTGSLAARSDSLADNPAFRAVASALEKKPLAGYGDIMGILFVGAERFAELDPCLPAGKAATAAEEVAAAYNECIQEWKAQPDLPRYDLVAFITQHSGGASYVTLALVFPKGANAEEAAQVLRERSENYTSDMLDRRMSEVWAERSVAVEKVASVEAEGRPIALLVLRSADPLPTPGNEPFVWAYVWSWWDMVFSLDVGFLSTQ